MAIPKKHSDDRAPCPEGEEQILGQGSWLKLVQTGQWEFVQRFKTKEAAVIIALTNDGKLVLVEQYRPAMGKNVIELPAGLIGDELGHQGEAPSEAAQRELLEETGYSAERLEELTHGCISPGICDEELTFFMAHNLKYEHKGGGVDGEDILVHLVELTKIHSWLEEQRSRAKVIDSKIFIGLYFIHTRDTPTRSGQS